jgi:hypothetical protein
LQYLTLLGSCTFTIFTFPSISVESHPTRKEAVPVLAIDLLYDANDDWLRLLRKAECICKPIDTLWQGEQLTSADSNTVLYAK